MFPGHITSSDVKNYNNHYKTHLPKCLPPDLSLYFSRHKKMVGFSLPCQWLGFLCRAFLENDNQKFEPSTLKGVYIWLILSLSDLSPNWALIT